MIRWERLGLWLAGAIAAPGPVEVEVVGGPASTGYSAETVVFDAAARRWVLRAETPDPPVYPPQVDGMPVEIEAQWRVMSALGAEGTVPVATIVGGSLDPTVIGTPFFVMEFVPGEVPAVDPPYTLSGFFAEAAPPERRAMLADGLRVLAGVHAVDWRAAGLGWLVPPGASPTMGRQLTLWEAYSRAELGERTHALLDQAFHVLHRHLPPGGAPALNWGDPRPGNIIWSGFRCVSVTDWEAASIAPPEMDLGWWLMFDRTCHEVVGAPRLEGEPSRDEQGAMYCESARRDVGDTRLYEVFAAARYCGIVVRVMNRAVGRGHMPADHTVWRDNPASAALAQLLDG
jgi:aminoglycoside phosphotransferase (APT) family kinase protein